MGGNWASDAGWHEVEASEMKENGAPEAVTVSEATCRCFDLLNAGVLTLGKAI